MRSADNVELSFDLPNGRAVLRSLSESTDSANAVASSDLKKRTPNKPRAAEAQGRSSQVLAESQRKKPEEADLAKNVLVPYYAGMYLQ